MKKWGSLLVILLLCVVITSPLWIWYLKSDNQWKIRVVDMTAPHPNYREHESLFWVFKHNKVKVPGEDRLFREDIDYIGYYPELSNYDQRRFTTRRLKREDLVGMDMLYLSDAYGVYVDDYTGYHGEEWVAHLDFSRLIFGGYMDDEARLIEAFATSGHAVIAEFNTFAEPTHRGARDRLEKLFGLKWSGWAGRWFEDLADTVHSVPHWAPRLWRMHYGEEWKFKGPGWLLAHEDTRLFVLEEPSEAPRMALKVRDIKEDEITKGVLGDVPFHTWFDINEAMPGTEVLASYHFNLTPAGQKELKHFGIPTVFPAIARASRNPLILYLAGDFSDMRTPSGPYFIYGYPWYKRLGRFGEHYRDATAFYWQFYVTLMSNILNLKIPKGSPMPVLDFGPPAPDAGIPNYPPSSAFKNKGAVAPGFNPTRSNEAAPATAPPATAPVSAPPATAPPAGASMEADKPGP